MKETNWSRFMRLLPEYFKSEKKMKVTYGAHKYMTVYFHDSKDDYFQRDGDVLIDDLGRRFRDCRLCGSLWGVRYIIPYDGAMEPGAYCRRCRKNHSLMDIKDAKRYGKVL